MELIGDAIKHYVNKNCRKYKETIIEIDKILIVKRSVGQCKAVKIVGESVLLLFLHNAQ